MNWIKLGSELVIQAITVIVTLAIGLYAWRKFMAPPIIEVLEEASKTAKMLANLGNLRRDELANTAGLEKTVAADLIHKQIPELEALKLVLDTGTWDKIEDAIENNPAAVIQLYEKWKHLIPGASQTQVKFDF